MMSTKNKVPTAVTAHSKTCPVCGRPSYSLGGVHPQCSFFRSDEKTLALRRRDRVEAEDAKRKL